MSQGREHKEICVVLPTREPYASALESNLARFGIAARLHYEDPLAVHPVIRKLMRAENPVELKSLRSEIQIPSDVDLRASCLAALEAFDAIVNESSTMADVLALIKAAKLPASAERADAIDVLDVRLATKRPIVFTCGATYFQYHDRALFDLAVSLATEHAIISYPRFNDKGDPLLRSFFLEDAGERISNIRAFPEPASPNADLPPFLAKNPSPDTLSPTSIESFLQCPFQFFARKTLHIRPVPAKPRDRLNMLAQGSILHRALAENTFDSVFEDECRKNQVPPGYRTEAIRLELLRHFEAFQADKRWPLKWPAQNEQKFSFSLVPNASIHGRMDVLLTGPHQEAIVIDYKYSAAAKIRERMDGDPIQAGLYLSAAERVFQLHPAGMFYCGLRQPITWEGWHSGVPGLKLGEARTVSALRELIQIAEAKSIEVFEAVASGEKSVRPSDRAKCRYCDYNEICRVESIAQTDRAIAP